MATPQLQQNVSTTTTEEVNRVRTALEKLHLEAMGAAVIYGLLLDALLNPEDVDGVTPQLKSAALEAPWGVRMVQERLRGLTIPGAPTLFDSVGMELILAEAVSHTEAMDLQDDLDNPEES